MVFALFDSPLLEATRYFTFFQELLGKMAPFANIYR